ncbi:hypothetical protein L21SP5_02446 [Salinivirga cyanobacteriivorans]|uniref:Uncharacterized protein n=1 Tax=Salinivirga cyanobacteriivorans TaxID=1307839 RepID=A0A0S2I126_9BACT|nr:hypothetical protein [Salinivirga cyanobacteriivorans]ALO16073.1 hypothetical protein L21SP5_02446 [Salinivirga cyanobacteriivorans]
MQLHEFIKPAVASGNYKKNQLGSRIKQWNRKALPENAIVILGVSNYEGQTNNLDVIRSELHTLFANGNNREIIDLGNIISLNEQDQSDVIAFLLNENQKTNSLLIILTEEQQYLSSYYRHSISKDLLIISEKLITNSKEEQLLKKKNSNLYYLGVQSYYLDPELCKKGRPVVCRLGQIRDGLYDTEPYFRMVTAAEIDLNAVRFSDFPQGENPNPNGLYAEELCQLAWFAGNSETLNCVVLNGYTHELSASETSLRLVAQAIWHILSGAESRQDYLPTKNPEKFKEIHLQNTKIPEQIIVYKSKLNGKHWLKFGKDDKIIPCTSKDMDELLQNNINDRIWSLMGLL